MLRFDLSMRSLMANQMAIQTTEHNISNASTDGYTRQDVLFNTSAPTLFPGVGYIGEGVQGITVLRKADAFITEEIQTDAQQFGRLEQEEKSLKQIESLLSPSDGGLLSEMQNSLDDLNTLSAYPDDISLRSTFKGSLKNMVESFHRISEHLAQIGKDVQSFIKDVVDQVNSISEDIAKLNEKIMASSSKPNDLLDQRDKLLEDLSGLVGIRVSYSSDNSAQVIVGNRLLVDKNSSNPLEAVDETSDKTIVRYKGSTDSLDPKEGSLAGGLNIQNEILPDYQNRLDTLAKEFAKETNRVHSTGIGLNGIGSLQSEESASDPDIALNQAGFEMKDGTLTIGVRDKNTGDVVNTDISIAPDGDTLNDVANHLSGVAHISASVDNGHLKLEAASGYEFTFSSDSADFLPELGLNTLFKGKNAKDLAITARVDEDVKNLALAKTFSAGNNENALSLLDTMQNKTFEELDGQTFQKYWTSTIGKIGEEVEAKDREVSLQSQALDDAKTRREEISGVSIDEELVNLKKYQYAYDAAARLFQTMNDLMETTVNLGRA